jgi:DNA repair exonuclease SbcCD ATPase subunit
MIISQKQTEDNYKKQISDLTKNQEDLFKTRYNDIDNELYKLDEDTIQGGISKVEGLIKQKKSDIETLESQVPMPQEEYDIDFYGLQKSELKELNETEVTLRLKISSLADTINMLKNSEICQTCKRPLDDVDHKDEITKTEGMLALKQLRWEDVKKKIEEVTNAMNHMDEVKNKWDSYNKNVLIVDKAKLELKAYEDSLSRGVDKLNQYKKIKQMVEKNKLIDTDIQTLKFKIDRLDEEKNMVSLQIKGIEKDIELSKSKIDEYNGLLRELKNEEVIDNIFKTYLEIYGKNGISKMVLGTMIPLINSHLKILLSDTCEFILEMRMNDKSEVEFWMVDQATEIEKPLNAGSGYEKTVSSLALRCVLSKVCSLPKPNIIVFDEVTGKVSNENLDKIGLFFDKLKQFFEHIWIISHNPLIQDWADHMVKVKKENNISTLMENYTNDNIPVV